MFLDRDLWEGDPEGEKQWGVRNKDGLWHCTPLLQHTQWFLWGKDVGHPGDLQRPSWIHPLVPGLIFWSEGNYTDALMVTVPSVTWSIVQGFSEPDGIIVIFGHVGNNAHGITSHPAHFWRLKVVLWKALAEWVPHG